MPVAVPSLALAFALALLFNGPGATLLLLAPIVALLVLVISGRFWQDSQKVATALPWGVAPLLMATYLVWLFASAQWSSWPELSSYYAWILGALPLTFLLWLWLDLAPGEWDRLWWLLATGAAAAGLWGIAEYISTGNRITGPFLDFNSYGALFNVFFFSALTRYLALDDLHPRGHLTTRLHEGLLLICLAALLATYSRGAIATWSVLLVMTLWLAGWHKLLQRKRVIILAIIIAFAAIFVATFKQTEIARPLVDLAADKSTQGRVMVWKAAWEIYKDHPWLGIGLGTHKLHYAYYRDPREIMTSGDLAHSDYLQFLEEGGPIQLAFLMAIGLLVISLAYTLLRRAPQYKGDALRAESLRTAGLLLGVGALFIHALVNFIFYILPLSLVTGLFLAQSHRALMGARLKTLRLQVAKPWAIAAIAFLGGLPVLLLTIDGVAATVFFRQLDLPLAQEIRADPQRSYEFASILRLARPRHTIPLSVMAEIESREARNPNTGPVGLVLAELAKEDYLKLIRIKPANADAFIGLGILVTDYPHLTLSLPPGMPQDAEGLFHLGITYNPADPSGYLALAELYEAQGRYQDAYDLIAIHAARWFRVAVSNTELRNKLVEKAESLQEIIAANSSKETEQRE